MPVPLTHSRVQAEESIQVGIAHPVPVFLLRAHALVVKLPESDSLVVLEPADDALDIVPEPVLVGESARASLSRIRCDGFGIICEL